MLIINGTVHTMDGLTIPNGYVAVSGSKIAKVGPMEECPAHWEGETIDANQGHILPGFIDAHCHVGMVGDGLGFEGDDSNEPTDPCTAHLRAIDGLKPFDRCFEDARAAGVTTVITGPGSANPINGQFAAIKTTGKWVEQMIIQEPLAMKFAMGENPKKVYKGRSQTPNSRMATAAIIRENLQKAVEYSEQMKKAEENEGEKKPPFNAKLHALMPVVRGELPAHIHAHKSEDIATAIRISKEFGLKLVIVHGTEGYRIPELLAQENIPVVTGPNLGHRSKPEIANMTIENPKILAMHGVKVAICTDHPVVPIQNLVVCAAMAVKGGLPPEAALEAITINAAQIAGIDERVGSLTPGKDADIIITSGHPVNMLSRVEAVFVEGNRVK